MGLQIPPPKIMLANKELQNESGFFILKDVVFKPFHLKDWFLIYQGRDGYDDEDADFFVKELIINAGKIGIKIEKPYYIPMLDTNPTNWIRTIEQQIQSGGKP